MNITDAKAELLSELRQLIEQSGDATHQVDLAAWLEAWLKEPLPALYGATPAQALRSAAGRRQLKILLERMRGGLPG